MPHTHRIRHRIAYSKQKLIRFCSAARNDTHAFDIADDNAKKKLRDQYEERGKNGHMKPLALYGRYFESLDSVGS